jgi:hypothetical protein
MALVPAIGSDNWYVLGNSIVTKVSKVYHSLMNSGGTVPASKWMWDVAGMLPIETEGFLLASYS